MNWVAAELGVPTGREKLCATLRGLLVCSRCRLPTSVGQLACFAAVQQSVPAVMDVDGSVTP